MSRIDISRPPEGNILAVLGDGQLSLLLINAAQKMGFETAVLSSTGEGPAVAHATQVIRGDMRHESAVSKLLQIAVVVAIDQELARETVLSGTQSANKIVPSLSVLKTLSDKIRQKLVLADHNIPTSPWTRRENGHPGYGAQRDKWLSEVGNKFSDFVLKLSTGGYDGRGVYIVRAPLSGEAQRSADDFLADAEQQQLQVYAESFVPYEAEIAVVGVRGKNGRFVAYPAVTTLQNQGICIEVRGGASGQYVPKAIAAQAENLAQKIGDIFGIVGTFAVEFFLTKDGEILVNEIAPRVHNSGHFSIEAARTSQFENHWRALLGLELAEPEVEEHFAMLNILGPSDYTGRVIPLILAKGGNQFCHWYGKSESRPRRKLGHLTMIAESAAALEEKVQCAKVQLDAWATSVIQNGAIL